MQDHMRPLYLWLVLILFTNSACDIIAGLSEKVGTEPEGNNRHVQLSLAVAPHVAWMPWYYAHQEGILNEYSVRHDFEVQFVSDDYQNLIESFLNEEIQAIVISNIDAIAQLVRRDIESDVILITNDSSGNEAILLPEQTDTKVHSLPGKTFALVQYSTRHYLLDRYLIKNQVPFEEINIVNIAETAVLDAFKNRKIYGVVSRNPYLYKLTHNAAAKILFDSRQIPQEIFDLLVVRREALLDYPKFAQALLGTWFSVMDRLQGSRKGPTLDAMAALAGLTRQELDEQLITTPLNDTPTKALSAIRDRRIRKTMRHIRYFIERYELSGSELFGGWVSYPGRTPALLHFNGQPLQDFVMPPVVKE